MDKDNFEIEILQLHKQCKTAGDNMDFKKEMDLIVALNNLKLQDPELFIQIIKKHNLK